jgi:hypothetical protein
MAESEQNPYRSPAAGEANPVTEPARLSASGRQPTLRFRWRIIPASVSFIYCFSLLVSGCIWVFQVLRYYFSEDMEWKFALNLTAMTAAIWIACVLGYKGGRNWMSGNWFAALSCNVAGGIIVFGAQEILLSILQR